jgi:hypothetical protein
MDPAPHMLHSLVVERLVPMPAVYTVGVGTSSFQEDKRVFVGDEDTGYCLEVAFVDVVKSIPTDSDMAVGYLGLVVGILQRVHTVVVEDLAVAGCDVPSEAYAACVAYVAYEGAIPYVAVVLHCNHLFGYQGVHSKAAGSPLVA